MTCPTCLSATGSHSLSCPSCGEALPVLPGARIDGRYEVLSRLGAGGMGTVFRARDLDLEQFVAVKVVQLNRSPQTGERFRSEIRLARRIKHKNVCSLWANGYEGNVAYVAMELVEGRDLRQLLRERGQLPWLEACQIAVQGAEGLQAIHEAGVIHRDLKAANVMIDAQGVVRLVDFGIAKASLKDAEAGRQADSSITETGQVVGSVEYMSPEQVRAAPLDARSDIYSFGIVLFELFTGRVPFRGDTPMSTMLKHLEDPPPLDGPVVALWPPDLRHILHRTLAKTPEDRYPSTRALLADLRHLRASLEDASTESRAVSVVYHRGLRFGRLSLVVAPGLLIAAAIAHLVLPRPGSEVLAPNPLPTPPPTTMEMTPVPAAGPPPTSPSRTLTPPNRRSPVERVPVATESLQSPTTTLPPPPPSTAPPPTTVPPPVEAATPTPPTTLPVHPGQLFAADDPEVVPPTCMDCPLPYSPIAERLGLQGEVVVEILVDEDGHVATPTIVEVRVSPDNQEVRKHAKELAVNTVSKRRYKPATKRGVPGKFHIKVTIKFQFQVTH